MQILAKRELVASILMHYLKVDFKAKTLTKEVHFLKKKSKC